jgi:BASS family bile acid:Na+ symporter
MNKIDQIQIHFDADSMWLVNITLAIIMFGVALDITIVDFKNLFKYPKLFFVGVFSQFFLVPLTTLILVFILKPHPSIALGMFMIAACPGGNVSNFMTKVANGNVTLSVSLTAFATVMSLFMTPINLALWASFYDPTAKILRTIYVDPFQVIQIVMLILGLPLIVGMLLRHYKPKKAISLAKYLKPISFLIFFAFIMVAFYNNMDVFVNYIHHVFYIVVLLNFILYLVGYYMAKIAGLPYKDQKTLSIETGIQNSGLGLMLVFLFFKEFGGMALIVAFWGIWDIFSGLALAYFWNLVDRKKSLIKKNKIG